MDTYFHPECGSSSVSGILLLQSLDLFPNKKDDLECTISTTSMTTLGNHSGLLTVIRRENPHSISHAVNIILNHQQSLDAQKTDALVKDRLKIVPIKSRKDRDDDKKAGGEVKGGFKYKWGGQDGSGLSVYVEGEAHDEHGNYVEGKAEHNISTGEGETGCHGGHKTEKN